MLRVSIIMPCLNQERFIQHAVQSVLEQQREGIEFLVVDGASTDQTPELLQQHEQQLRWISQADQGCAEAFNNGLSATSGELIGWLNADDAYMPDTIEQACSFFDENPEVDVVYGGIQQIDDQGEALEAVSADSWSADRLKNDCFLHIPAVFFRRRVVDRFGDLDTRLKYWADYEYWTRLARGGARFERLTTLVACRRIHPDGRRFGSQCQHQRAASLEELNGVIANVRGRIGSRKILYYAHAKAMSEGYSRETVGFDRVVMKHALAGNRIWNTHATRLAFSKRVVSIVCRQAGKEIDSLVRHPHLAVRFLPKSFREFTQTYLRRKIFKLKIHEPRPISLPSYYTPPCKLTDPPLISVVTPNLNQGEYIEDAITSVTGQGYPRLEYIVQDGVSTDNSVEVIRRHERDLARWDSAPDRGQSHAINRGMRHATGEIMAFLNSDDLLMPGSLAYVAEFFQQNPQVDVVYGHRILVNEAGEEIGRWVLPRHDDRVLPWADYIPQETMFWRRSAWEKVGGLDETFHFALDWDLILRFQAAGLRFVRLPRFLGAFRVTEAQKTSRLVETVGTREMNRLRKRVLGREPSRREIRRVLRPYMWRHFVCDTLYSLGVAKY